MFYKMNDHILGDEASQSSETGIFPIIYNK
jgi:hypothetical protein